VRILVALALVLTACGKDHGSTAKAPDAAALVPPDVDQNFCDATASSSHVSIVIGGVPTAFTSVHMGGSFFGGGVTAPATVTPMSLFLIFVDETHLPVNTAFSCTAPGQGCPYDGIAGHADCIGCDTDVGPHPIMLQSLQHGVTVQGTVTITDYVAPVYPSAGHITGSLSSPDAVVTGTFENDFCTWLLSTPI
jgi:hypothetical protein